MSETAFVALVFAVLAGLLVGATAVVPAIAAHVRERQQRRRSVIQSIAHDQMLRGMGVMKVTWNKDAPVTAQRVAPYEVWPSSEEGAER